MNNELKPILTALGIIGAIATAASIIESERHKRKALADKARIEAKLNKILELLS